MQIEIDLSTLCKYEGGSKGSPGLVKRKVKVTRGGKVFEQYRWVKSGKDEPEGKKPSVEEKAPKPKKELAIMGLNKPKPEKLEGIVSKLKVGMIVNLMGKPKIVENINFDTGNVALNDGNNYTFGAINKFGSIVEEKPKVEKKPKPKPESETKVKEVKSEVKEESGFLAFTDKDAKNKMDKYIKTKEFKNDKKTQEAINAYTLTHYGPINTYLRDGDLLGSDKDEIEGYINKFSSFLDSAPKVDGKFYRGMHFYKEDKDGMADMGKFIGSIEKSGIGGEIELPSFTSTTPSRDMAEAFAESGKKRSHSVVIEMQTKSGVYLNGLSPIDNEVTLNKGSKFKVILFDKSDSDNMVLKLEEI